MPVSPATAEHLAAGVVAHYQDAEAALVARIARNLSRGLDAPTWAADKLAQMQEYERQARRLLADLEKKAATGVRTAITDAYERGGMSAVADLAKMDIEDVVAMRQKVEQMHFPVKVPSFFGTSQVGIANTPDEYLALRAQAIDEAINSPTGVSDPENLRRTAQGYRSAIGGAQSVENLAGLRAVEALTRETLGNVLATHPGILRSTMDAYRSVIAESSSGVLLGDQTRRQAAQAALNRFAQKGVTGFIDKAGRGWSMESYTEMAMRTGCGRAAVQGHVDRLVANGLDLVIVSDAPRECPLCREWEGVVLSLSGRTPGYPTLAEARAAGLFHCTCRHNLSLYQPGITRPMGGVADPQGYAATTRLRYLERQTRAAKRVQAAAMDDAARQAAGVRVRAYQAKIRAHVASTTAKRQPIRERLGAL